MAEWINARIQLCGRFAVAVDGLRIEGALPGRRGRLLFAYLVLHRGRPLLRDELLMAGWGRTPPQRREARSTFCYRSCGTAWAPIGSRGARRSSCSSRPRRLSMSRQHSKVRTGRSPASQKNDGRPPGVRPVSPTTSRPGRSFPGTRPPGSMTGGAGWRRSGSGGWSAWPRPASVSAARRWRRRRSVLDSSPRLRPTGKPGTSSSFKPLSSAAIRPKRFAPTSGCGCCCGRNWGSPPAQTCRLCTGGCWVTPTATITQPARGCPRG